MTTHPTQSPIVGISPFQLPRQKNYALQSILPYHKISPYHPRAARTGMGHQIVSKAQPLYSSNQENKTRVLYFR